MRPLVLPKGYAEWSEGAHWSYISQVACDPVYFPEEKQSNDAADSVGLSLENASYIEENLKTTEFKSKSENSPKLFNSDEEISEMDISKDIKEDDLFEKDFVNDEEFEIPAFLRKQKY